MMVEKAPNEIWVHRVQLEVLARYVDIFKECGAQDDLKFSHLQLETNGPPLPKGEGPEVAVFSSPAYEIKVVVVYLKKKRGESQSVVRFGGDHGFMDWDAACAYCLNKIREYIEQSQSPTDWRKNIRCGTCGRVGSIGYFGDMTFNPNGDKYQCNGGHTVGELRTLAGEGEKEND